MPGRSKKKRRRWVLLTAVLVVCALVAGAILFLRLSPIGRAASNVVQYRARVLYLRWFGDGAGEGGAGAIGGIVRDAEGTPLPGALILVSTARGMAYHTHSDERGTYQLDGVPPGRYVPVAGKWGYRDTPYQVGSQERTPVAVRPEALTPGIDFALADYPPWRPSLDVPAILGPPETGYALFPAEISAQRTQVTFVNDGLTITTTFVYEPLEPARPAAQDKGALRPAVMVSYPSDPLEWDRVSVALAHEGYVVLAHGPSPVRRQAVDIHGIARDFVQAIAYLRDGQLAERIDHERTAWLGGSFGSLVLYRTMWEEYAQEGQVDVDAMVWVGGISDAFLGVQSLYDVDLAIPARFQDAIASLGRPDRDPAFFLGFSPSYNADQMPPTLIAHTLGDEVIPYNQSVRFSEALDDAGIEHELYLYQDTTHYLDQVNITPETAELYRRLATFLDRHLRQGE
jgi:hypothetical protein